MVPRYRAAVAEDAAMTPNKQELLLCELHAHTTWSDGSQTIGQLVDTYGHARFDVLCITDHVVRPDGPYASGAGPEHIHAGNYDAYLTAIEIEAARARVQYDMLVLPGLELTYDDADPLLGVHAVAVGLDRFVAVADGIERALGEARRSGAALIAAHPYAPAAAARAPRATARFAREWHHFAPLVDRWELINRRDVFDWVARAGLPAVASGDAHEPGHLLTWKTVIPCRKDRTAVVDHLRSPAPVYLADAAAAATTHASEAVIAARVAS
jgi:predicted metal-dependent phosphoesterase TrpH